MESVTIDARTADVAKCYHRIVSTSSQPIETPQPSSDACQPIFTSKSTIPPLWPSSTSDAKPIGIVPELLEPIGVSVDEAVSSPSSIEKASPDLPGAFQVINQQFLEHQWSGYEFVNREQDLGVPGLRQAKESYLPHHMVEKFIVRRRAPG